MNELRGRGKRQSRKNMKGNKILWIMAVLLLVANPAFAESGTFSVGVIGGWGGSLTDEAIDGFPDTKFKNSGVYGGSIMYRFPSGFALELCVERFSMDLEELGEDFGTLNITPVILLLKVQGMPQNGTGFTGHADIGGGINFTSFDRGSFITDVEKTLGVQYTIDTDNSFVFEIGAGMDYFFTKNLSMSLDSRLLGGDVGTSWEVSGPGGTLMIEDIDRFHVFNFQGLLSIRFWFK